MKKALLVALIVASTATVSFAQDRGDRQQRRPGGNFMAAARTDDGKIDLSKLPEQMPQQRKDAMKAADKDGDGFLSPEEFRATMPRRDGQAPQGMRDDRRPEGRPGEPGFGPREGAPRPFGDAFKDGKIEIAKMPEGMPEEMKKAFKDADKDADGFLTMEEMRAMPRPEGQPRVAFGSGSRPEGQPGDRPEFGPRPEGQPGDRPEFGDRGPQGAPRDFGDAFKDGKVELAKLPEGMPQEMKDNFAKADKDSDGFLTQEEMRDMPRPKFKFPEGKKPAFINDDNAFVVDKVVEAIKGCDKNGDGVICEDEQKEAAKYIRENFGPSFNMFLSNVLGAHEGFGGFGGPQGFGGGFGGFGGPQGFGGGFGPGFGGPQGFGPRPDAPEKEGK